MLLTSGKVVEGRPSSAGAVRTAPSSALEWLWKTFDGVHNPHILDCGPVSQATVDVLLRRRAKVYVTDFISPMQRREPRFWGTSGQQPVLLVDELLAQVPHIPPGSLSVVFCWHLLDLVPREAAAVLVDFFWRHLHFNGVLFCLLREPYLVAGAQTSWWLESLNVLGSSGPNRQPFPYPALTNREMERLIPSGAVKTFLTRSGRREVLALK